MAVAVLSLQLALPVRAANEVREQTVTPLVPQQEQRVEPLVPEGEQRVEALDAEGIQQVTQGTKGPVRRGAETAAKVVLGVLAAGVAIGAMVASLMLL